MNRLLLLPVLAGLLTLPAALHAEDPEITRQTFGELKLIDEIIIGQNEEEHGFRESDPGVSKVEEILGKPTRVIPNVTDKGVYITYTLGKGMGLEAGKAYVLQVEYPEDAPRIMSIHNRGAETSRGVFTGKTLGDVVFGRYVNHNPESLDYPLSGEHEAFQMLFHLQDHAFSFKIPRGQPIKRDTRPEDGVPVIISQWKALNAPLSEGAAVSRIALYEVVDEEALTLAINYPPEELPRRHLFWREEMSDGIVSPGDPGWDNETDWFETKARKMEFLGMNTYTVDMLEFGHNQGWDTSSVPNWMNASSTPQRWEKIVNMLKEGGYDFTLLPYYEYAGSVGGNSPGTKRFARPLKDTIDKFTQIPWSESAYADVTEPAILEDAKLVLDLTIIRFKDIMPFSGAWIRPRPSHMPVSFSDNAIAKFNEETGRKATRKQLQERGALYTQYIGWYNDQRKLFLTALRDHLRENGVDDAFILFTADASEPGYGLRFGPQGDKIVTDDVAGWRETMRGIENARVPVSIDEVVKQDYHLKSMLAPHWTWGDWEWEHSLPSADPANYKDTEGVLFTFTFNRAYTVMSSNALDAYRTPSGLAIARHYGLNENEMEESVGYFVMDMDRAGPYMMHSEVLAMANGDPTHIGYLAGHVFNRGFPHYARRFNQAFLALPALPSEVVEDASSDKEVVVRAIETEGHGTYLSISNTGLQPKEKVTIKLPAQGKVTDAATGEALEASNGSLELSMDAVELRAIHIE